MACFKGTACPYNHRGIDVALPKKLQENAEVLTTWLQQKSEKVFQALVQRGDPQHITSYGSALLSILNVVSWCDACYNNYSTPMEGNLLCCNFQHFS